MSIFKKIKGMIKDINRPVSGLALIKDVQQVEAIIEEVVEEVLSEQEELKNQSK